MSRHGLWECLSFVNLPLLIWERTDLAGLIVFERIWSRETPPAAESQILSLKWIWRDFWILSVMNCCFRFLTFMHVFKTLWHRMRLTAFGHCNNDLDIATSRADLIYWLDNSSSYASVSIWKVTCSSCIFFLRSGENKYKKIAATVSS